MPLFARHFGIIANVPNVLWPNTLGVYDLTADCIITDSRRDQGKDVAMMADSSRHDELHLEAEAN